MRLQKYLKGKLFYLALISFVVVAGSTLILEKKEESTPVVTKTSYLGSEVFPPIPVLIGESTYPVFSAQSVLAIDINSGISLYEKNPDSKLLPASTTKIVTAMVAIDYYPLDKVLTVGEINVIGQKMNLVKGEKLTVGDLLYGLLVYSANDAAEALAQNYLGQREGFINAMNLKAEELYLTNTNFTNPTGLDGGDHYSTARDLVRASYVAMQNKVFSEIVGTKEKTITSIDGKIVHRITNVNKLLETVDGVIGVKTGWTEEARENLVTLVDRDGHKIIIAVLGSQDRFGETEELINWIYESYEWRQVTGPEF